MNDGSTSPKKKTYRKQTTRIQVRMTPETHTKIKAVCEASGKSMSEVIRIWVEGRNVTSRVDIQQYNQLRQLGGLLKHALQDLRSKGQLDNQIRAQFEEALSGIVKSTETLVGGNNQ